MPKYLVYEIDNCRKKWVVEAEDEDAALSQAQEWSDDGEEPDEIENLSPTTWEVESYD